MNLPGSWELQLISDRSDSLTDEERSNKPALQLEYKCILQVEVLCTEKHLVACVEHLLLTSLIREVFLPLLSSSQILTCLREDLFHSRHKSVDSLMECGVNVSNQLSRCTRMVAIVQKERRIPG